MTETSVMLAYMAQATVLIFINLVFRVFDFGYYYSLALFFAVSMVMFNIYVYLRGRFGRGVNPLWALPLAVLISILLKSVFEDRVAEALSFMLACVVVTVFGDSDEVLGRAELHRGVLLGFLVSFMVAMYFRFQFLGIFLMAPLLEYLSLSVTWFDGLGSVVNGAVGGLLVATLPLYPVETFPYVAVMAISKHVFYRSGASMWIVALDYFVRPFVLVGGVLWSIGILY